MADENQANVVMILLMLVINLKRMKSGRRVQAHILLCYEESKYEYSVARMLRIANATLSRRSTAIDLVLRLAIWPKVE